MTDLEFGIKTLLICAIILAWCIAGLAIRKKNKEHQELVDRIKSTGRTIKL